MKDLQMREVGGISKFYAGMMKVANKLILVFLAAVFPFSSSCNSKHGYRNVTDLLLSTRKTENLGVTVSKAGLNGNGGAIVSCEVLNWLRQGVHGRAMVGFYDILGVTGDEQRVWRLNEIQTNRLREIFRERAIPNPNRKRVLQKGLIIEKTGIDCDFEENVIIFIGKSTDKKKYYKVLDDGSLRECEEADYRYFSLADIAPASKKNRNSRAYYLLPDDDYQYIINMLPMRELLDLQDKAMKVLSPAVSND